MKEGFAPGIAGIGNPPPLAVPGKAAAVYVFSLYLSVSTVSLFLRNIGGVAISTYDFVFLFLLLIVAFRLAAGRTVFVPADGHVKTFAVLLGLFFCWLLFQMVRFDHLKSLTFVLIVARGYAFFLCAVILCRIPPDLARVNAWVFRTGVFMACLFLPAFVIVFAGGPGIFGGIAFYEQGEFGSLRLEGFAGDANFYGLYLSLALFCGLALSRRAGYWRKPLYWAGFALILCNVALTVSRSIFLSLVAGSLVFSMVRNFNAIEQLKRVALLVTVAVSAALLILNVKLPILGDSVAIWYVKRSTAATPRTGYNTLLYEKFLESPFIGHGMRSSEAFLGGFGVYAHNSYLELLVETGMIGFGIYMLFYLYTLISGVVAMRKDEGLAPWVHAWIMAGFMMPFFTLYQMPVMWLISGVIAARVSRAHAGRNPGSLKERPS